MTEPWDEARALRYALGLLSRREHGRVELRRRLAGKPVPDEVAEAVMARLEAWGYLDDARFAASLVRAKRGERGRIALGRELDARGVDEATRDAALAELDEADQLEAARGLLRKHAWRFASDDPRKDRAKARQLLARRGFEAEVAREAIDDVFDAEPDAP